MATPPESNPGALVVDANVLIAMSTKESGRDALATAEIADFVSSGYQLFSPGVAVAETLYVLCGKRNSGSLSLADYNIAVATFVRIMASVFPPPSGDTALIEGPRRSEEDMGAATQPTGFLSRLRRH
jgi:predicted nucleic acid-binding protein